MDFSDFDEMGIFTFRSPFNIYEWIPPIVFAQFSNNLTAYIPENRFFDRETIERYNGSLYELTGIRPEQLFTGQDITIKLDFFLQMLNKTDITTVQLPLKQAVDTVYEMDFVPRALRQNFTVAKSFVNTYGKVPSALGNTAILDCNYLNQTFLATFDNIFTQITDEQPLYYLFLKQARTAVVKNLQQIDFCKYALQVNGLVRDQVGVYVMTDEKQINK